METLSIKNDEAIKNKKKAIDQANDLIHRADILRDQCDYLQAGLCYRQAVTLVPWRTDLIIQMANMFKDSGLCDEAVKAYREALVQTPKDPDIYLQLGRALIMMGRKHAGIEALQQAIIIEPDFDEALYELGKQGVNGALARYNDSFVGNGGVSVIRSLTADILKVQSVLAEISAKLPDVEIWSAVPVERYGRFSKLFDIPNTPLDIKNIIRIRVISPADCLEISQLYKQIESLRSQTYTNWEVIFYGRSSVAREAIQRVAVGDERFQWREQPAEVTDTYMERMAAMGAEEWLLLVAKGAVFHSRAFEWYAAVTGLSSCSLFCCDAKVSTDDNKVIDYSSELLARWAFDPEIMLQRNIWGDTLLVKASVNAACAKFVDSQSGLSGRRSALLLSIGCVAHLPLVLVNLPNCEANKERLTEHFFAVQAYIAENNIPVQVSLPSKEIEGSFVLKLKKLRQQKQENISVVICTRNNAADCEKFVKSLKTSSLSKENNFYIIVDNGTDKEQDINIIEKLGKEENVFVYSAPGIFNWSELNNRAATMAKDGIIVFANDDMLMLSQGWDENIRAALEAPQVGVLGAKLLYPDQTIQHGGIIFGWNDSVIHDGIFEDATSSAQLGRWQMERHVSAVTGAFMCVRKSIFESVGGFDAQNFAVSYNDVDFCLRIRQAGYGVIWSPNITLLHYESKSRGVDYLFPAKRARDDAERKAIYRKWGKKIFTQDPTVNPIWYDATIPFSLLRPVTVERVISYLGLECSNLDGSVRKNEK